jgi:hypothetical protein
VKSLTEGSISFEFGDDWEIVEKWDACSAHTEGVGKLDGSKAVDFVGVHGGELYLIEVKDFRGYAIENKERQVHDLPLEIGHKVRDSLAGLVGRHQRDCGPEWIGPLARSLFERKHPVWVVAWIAEDRRSSEPDRRREMWQATRRDRLKQKLSWLTGHVEVASPFESRVPDVVARNLPEKH